MSGQHSHDLGPSSFLVDHLGLLPRGRALDLAMGYGRTPPPGVRPEEPGKARRGEGP